MLQRWKSTTAVQRDTMTGEIISLPDIDVSFEFPQTTLADVVLQPSLLKIEPLKNPKTPLPSSKLIFGKTFTDHMLMVPWSSESGWAEPLIKECKFEKVSKVKIWAESRVS
jgi:branched-chain amino acid aminotransferase